MKNSLKMEYTEERIKKMGFIAICAIIRELLISGKRIAVMKELRSIKMMMDPTAVDLEDLDLLRILKEPHVKLASELADFIYIETLQSYANICYLDDDTVMEDKWAVERADDLVWRYMFYREHHLRRDRYINFTKVLKSSQRVIYEFLKLMITGETRMLDRTYRTNYSPGRLKALVADHTDPIVMILVGLIEKLKDAEARSIAIPV